MAGDANSLKPGETQKCWSTCLQKNVWQRTATHLKMPPPSGSLPSFSPEMSSLPPRNSVSFLPPHAATVPPAVICNLAVRLLACLAHPCELSQCIIIGRARKELSSLSCLHAMKPSIKYSVMGWNLGLKANLKTAKFNLPLHKPENRGLDRLSVT